ncbi:hypothetical protein LY90DRAFT_665558 [Neocallimastix californiae]|uniref:RBP-J/Cbf11/Cbf12 DNA binding domain-containing protein n=1 Tax=Neocallimastix californiae TaxID=1754190 RepID=A0A1Y2EZ47_9FUNG|nr:hypothetical protein LY90DRAFT_665558 [Neocallimastix californiae]|eukprot:ORY76840.1 hypothetical protein LY90DRAFT_665558 [Neocallimastix californiae]
MISQPLTTSNNIKLDNSQRTTTSFVFDDSPEFDNQKYKLSTSFNYSTDNFVYDNALKLNSLNSFLTYIPNVTTPPLIQTSKQELNPSTLLNPNLNMTNMTNSFNITSSSNTSLPYRTTNLTTSFFSPSFSSSNYDGILPSPYTSPTYEKLINNYTSINQQTPSDDNQHENLIQQVISSSSSSPIKSNKINEYINNMTPSYPQSEAYISNQNNSSIQDLKTLKINNPFNFDMYMTTSTHQSMNDVDDSTHSFLLNQNSSSHNGYDLSFKNPIVTPNSIPKKNENEMDLNQYSYVYNNSSSYSKNSPFLSPLQNQSEKQSFHSEPYNQLLYNSPKFSFDYNPQKDNENIINQYFNFNTNSNIFENTPQDLSNSYDSNPFLNSISNNDEINLTGSINSNNDSSDINESNIYNGNNNSFSFINNNLTIEKEKINDDFFLNLKNQNDYLENLNYEFENSLMKTNITDNYDNSNILLSSPFDSNLVLNNNELNDFDNKAFYLNNYDNTIIQNECLLQNSPIMNTNYNNNNIPQNNLDFIKNANDNTNENQFFNIAQDDNLLNEKENTETIYSLNMIKNYLNFNSKEITIVLANSKVAQKSYGSEKRFFCPPPSCKLYGGIWNFMESNNENTSKSNQKNTDNICSQVNTSFTSSTLPKLYLSLMSEKEFIHRNSESKKKSNQQNFSICGNLIIEPTRVSLKKIYHKKELKEIAQQSKEKSFSNDETLYKNNIKNKYIKNNDNLSNKPSADVETIGKCLFKHLYISDSDKRKYFSFFVKEDESCSYSQKKNQQKNDNSDVFIGDPLSQLHKIALQVKEDPSLYLCTVNEKIGWIRGFGVKKVLTKKKKMEDIRIYEDIPESAVWTIVGTEHIKYSFILPHNSDLYENNNSEDKINNNNIYKNIFENNSKRRKINDDNNNQYLNYEFPISYPLNVPKIFNVTLNNIKKTITIKGSNFLFNNNYENDPFVSKLLLSNSSNINNSLINTLLKSKINEKKVQSTITNHNASFDINTLKTKLNTYTGFFGPFMASNIEVKNDEQIIIHIPHYIYDFLSYKSNEKSYNNKKNSKKIFNADGLSK